MHVKKLKVDIAENYENNMQQKINKSKYDNI
jgi:hypothetical protein